MRNSLIGSILAVMEVLSFSSLILGQTAQQPGAAKAQMAAPTPDLSGVWMESPANKQPRMFTDGPIPMQPWAEEKCKAIGCAKSGIEFHEEMDPRIARCAPLGFPRMMVQGNFPFEIFQVPGRVIMFFEVDHEVRQIWTDGRGHPEEPNTKWFGHSVGRRDGDTLVVDTIGLTDKTWLDRQGTPHSDALHVVERIRRVSHDTLEIEFRFDDQKAFTKAWTGKRVYTLKPGWEIMEDIACEDRILQDSEDKIWPFLPGSEFDAGGKKKR